MNFDPVADLPGAARHLEAAHTAIVDAVAALKKPDGAKTLLEFGRKLSEMAQFFRDGMLMKGLSVPLIDARTGARAMGSSRSEKKLEALAKARAVRLEKRRLGSFKVRKSRSRL